MITEKQYSLYAKQGYAKVPIVMELPADLETPLGIYFKLADAPFSFLLESVSKEESWGRFSIIGLPSAERLEIHNERLLHFQGNDAGASCAEDPLGYIEKFLEKHRMPLVPGAPRFAGGLTGYFGYEISGLIEPRLANIMPLPSKPDVPDAMLLVTDEAVIIDRLRNVLYILVCANIHEQDAYRRGKTRVNEIAEQLRDTRIDQRQKLATPLCESDFTSRTGKAAFTSSVAKALRYIADGDIMQVVVSQRLEANFPAPPMAFYRSLRNLNPSPYMYYLNLEQFHIVGSSPEILVRKENDLLTLRPIAGTRARSDDPRVDALRAKELLKDPKELAEHLMLVDLGRNDLGRVCATGEVAVDRIMEIERYSHVMHMVSNIVGRSAPNVSAMDILKATFPAGTVTGAPKIRAMELIAEFETTRRSVYAGTIGYISWTGAIDAAIAIRTAIIKDKKIFAQAGAGLVFDSQPENEWEETMSKARVLIQAAINACG